MHVLVTVHRGVVDDVYLGRYPVLQRMAEEWEEEHADNDAPILPLKVAEPGGPNVKELARVAVEEMGDVFFDPNPRYDGVTADQVRRHAQACVERAILKALAWEEADRQGGGVTVVLHLRGMDPERLADILDDYFSNSIFDADFGGYAIGHPLGEEIPDGEGPYVADWDVFRPEEGGAR